MNAIKLGLLFIFLFFLPTGLQTSWTFYSAIFNNEAHIHAKFLIYVIDMSPVIISLVLLFLPSDKLEKLFPQQSSTINTSIDFFARIAVFGLTLFYGALVFYKASSLAYIIATSIITGFDNRQIITGMSVEIISGLAIIFISMKYYKPLIHRFFDEHA